MRKTKNEETGRSARDQRKSERGCRQSQSGHLGRQYQLPRTAPEDELASVSSLVGQLQATLVGALHFGARLEAGGG